MPLDIAMAGADFGTCLIFRFIWPSERPPVQSPLSVLEHIGAVDHPAFAFSLLAVDLAVFAFERELEQQMRFVAETLPAAGLELRADFHQLGLRLAIFERLFALLEIGAQTSEGKTVHPTVQEVADVVAVLNSPVKKSRAAVALVGSV